MIKRESRLYLIPCKVPLSTLIRHDIILLFPSPMSISNQSIVNQNYIENEALVTTVDFRSISGILGRSTAEPVARAEFVL